MWFVSLVLVGLHWLGSDAKVRPGILQLKCDVPEELESGAAVYSFGNATNLRLSGPNSEFFFLANGQTVTAKESVSLQDKTSLNLIDDNSNVAAELSIVPSKLSPHKRVASYRGSVEENQPPDTKVVSLEGLLTNSNILRAELVNAADGRLSKEFYIDPSTSDVRTKKWLDRETRSRYDLRILRSPDEAGEESRQPQVLGDLVIDVRDVNDNLPVFNVSSTRLVWKVNPEGTRRYTILGKVSAFDPDDGDEVVYGLERPDPCCIVVPQTGEVMLVDPEAVPTQLSILAKEKRIPTRMTRLSAIIDIIDSEDEILDDDDENSLDDKAFEPHIRQKRRVTRAVRPTKRTEFTEADGQLEGKIVFQLEKESEHETFKIRDENPWVTVEPNGAVRVKKRWDYEELGREKTIDFWVIITNSGAAGKLNLIVPTYKILVMVL